MGKAVREMDRLLKALKRIIWSIATIAEVLMENDDGEQIMSL